MQELTLLTPGAQPVRLIIINAGVSNSVVEVIAATDAPPVTPPELARRVLLSSARRPHPGVALAVAVDDVGRGPDDLLDGADGLVHVAAALVEDGEDAVGVEVLAVVVVEENKVLLVLLGLRKRFPAAPATEKTVPHFHGELVIVVIVVKFGKGVYA